MLRVGKHIGHTAVLYDMAVFHHRNTVSKLAHHVQVVGNQQHGHVVAFLQVTQQVQYLLAQRNVKRSGRLVSQQ